MRIKKRWKAEMVYEVDISGVPQNRRQEIVRLISEEPLAGEVTVSQRVISVGFLAGPSITRHGLQRTINTVLETQNIRRARVVVEIVWVMRVDLSPPKSGEKEAIQEQLTTELASVTRLKWADATVYITTSAEPGRNFNNRLEDIIATI